jgi:hypothetical protein
VNCIHTVSLGAYLLGSLEPGERSSFERHLGDCRICRDELVRLAPLPGLLGQVDLADLQQPHEAATWQQAAAPPLDPKLEPERAPDAPHPRRRLALAAAGVLVVLLIVAGVLVPRLLEGTASPAVAPVTWSASDQTTGAEATAAMAKQPWGTEVQIKLNGVPPGLRCKLVVHDQSGRSEVGGWWGTSYTEGEQIPASTSFSADQIDYLEVVADMRVLVTLRR